MKWTRNRENIEVHAHDVAHRDVPRTLFPMPVFAGPSLKNHRDELFCVRANHLFTVLTSYGPMRCNSRIQNAVARVFDIGFQLCVFIAGLWRTL